MRSKIKPKTTNDNGIITTHTLDNICPICKSKLNAATAPDGRSTPVAGDVSLCIKCSAVLEFDKKLNVVLLTEKTRKKLSEDVLEEIAQIQRAICAMHGSPNHIVH
jgi:hypothetical protein